MPGQRWMILAVLFRSTSGDGIFSFNRFGSAAKHADAGSGNGLFPDRHAVGRLSVARRHCRVFRRECWASVFRDKTARSCRPVADGVFPASCLGRCRGFHDGSRLPASSAASAQRSWRWFATKMTTDWFGRPRNRPCDVDPAGKLAVRCDAGAADPGPYRASCGDGLP